MWILLGHAASLLPAGTPAFRVNLTACAYHALALSLVFVSGYALARRWQPALFATIALGACSPLFASWSLQAEVFSLNDLFAAAIVLTCLLWIQTPSSWFAPLLGLFFGLGLSNHQSLVLLLPIALWALYCNRAWLRNDRRALPLLAGSVAIALCAFLVPYAHTVLASRALGAWHFGSARTAGELRDLILRRAYGGFNLVPRAADQGGTLWQRLAALAVADGWPLAAALLGAVIGWFSGKRRESTVAAAIVVFPLFAFCAVANVDVHDELLRAVFQRFGLLSLTALAPFAALIAMRPFVAWAACAIAAILGAATLPGLSLRDEHGPRTLFTDVFRALPQNAILMTAGDPVDQPPAYFQRVEGWRPDVTIVTYGLLDFAPYVEALRSRLNVPQGAAMNLPPVMRRDLLIAANARPFFVAGERGIHAPGPRYHPEVFGVTSQLVPNGTRNDLAAEYRRQVALQSAPNYGDVPAARWRTNGFGTTVREYYAGGFFSTGLVAERLGDALLARGWYEKARTYYDDPIIAAQIERLSK